MTDPNQLEADLAAAAVTGVAPVVPVVPAAPTRFAIVSYAALYTAVGAIVPYLSLFYQSLGMTLDAIGLLSAVSALTSLFASPAWGILSDRFPGRPLALVIACLASAALAGVLSFATDPLSAALIVVLYSLAVSGIGPLLDARVLETLADDHPRYGRLRVWGSAAFVVSAVGVGILVQAQGLRSFFLVLIGALVVTAVVASRFGPSGGGHRMPRLQGLQAVLGNRPLMWFIFSGLIVWSSSTSINAFFSIHLTALGAPESIVGSAWALGALVEIPLMLAYPVLAKRFGGERLLLLGIGLLLLRAVALALVRDPLLVTLTMTLHGAGFALLLVSSITYVAGRAPRGAVATAQGVFAGVSFGLSNAIGPSIGGVVAANYGLPQLFTVAAVTTTVGMVAVGWAVLQRANRGR